MKMSCRMVTLPAIVLAALVGVAAQPGQNAEVQARRQYNLALDFLQKQSYAEALKDFQAVVDSYPASSVAGDALVQIAQYHLDVARDPAEAFKAAETVVTKYSSSSPAAAAYAHVLKGRIALARGRAPADVREALAEFERVPGLFPGSDAIPSAIFYAGDLLRTVRRHDEALEKYRDVTLKYPSSGWAAKALVGAAMCLVQTGRAVTAMEGLQRVRAMSPGSPEAAAALSLNTILYRLYIRAPGQPAYTYATRMFGGPTAKFKDVAAVAVDSRDNVLLAHKSAVTVFDGKGAIVKSLTADNPSAVSFTAAGVPVVIRENALTPEGANPIRIAVPQPDGKSKPVEEIPGALVTPGGSWLIADRKGKAILVFSPAGKYEKSFVSTPVDRFAINVLGDIAVLDRDGKHVTLFDGNGKLLGTIMTKGTGYELESPVDVAFDSFGHVYVLDRSKASVFVFNPQATRLLTTFSVPEKSPGAFQKAVAFGLDSAARLYIFDDRAQHVQLYQ